MQISRQMMGRHNTLDFAYGKIVCQRGKPPLETPGNGGRIGLISLGFVIE